MPEPNEYLVVKGVQAALAAISVAGEYYYNVGGLAVKLDPDQAVDSLVPPDGPRPFVLLDVQPDSIEVSGTRPNRATVTMPLNVFWVNNSDPTDDDDWMRTYFRGCADVERAIATVGPSLHQSLLAFDVRVTGRTANHQRGSQVWAAIAVRVSIGRVFGQP